MADGPQGRGEVAALLARHGVEPRRSLGQHFVVDPNLVRRIVEIAGVGPDDQVIEVGAGTGTLTAELAARGASVVAWEVDRRLTPVLGEVLAGLDNVEVRWGDALAELPASLGPGRWILVANLPYHIGTPLVLELLQRAPAVERYVIMVQREVARRFAARPGTKEYGIPSVIVALYAAVSFPLGSRLPPRVFLPEPEVVSTVVELVRRDPPTAGAGRAVELAAAAFRQRRKQLRNSLALELADADAIAAAAGVDLRRRSDDLGPEEYAALAAAEAVHGR